ncbi:unnamed protein product [Colias eurytheme]|nr:unnamed protein product [Colias eurytheme]
MIGEPSVCLDSLLKLSNPVLKRSGREGRARVPERGYRPHCPLPLLPPRRQAIFIENTSELHIGRVDYSADTCGPLAPVTQKHYEKIKMASK